MQFNGILELLLHRIKCRAGRRSPVTSGRGPHVCSLAQGPHATYEKISSVLNIFKMYNEETCREFTQNGQIY